MRIKSTRFGDRCAQKAWTLLLLLAVLWLPAGAARKEEGAAADFDAAGGIPVGIPSGKAVSGAKIAALEHLAATTGQRLVISYNGVSGSPRKLAAVRPLSAPKAALPATIARDFLEQHREIWGFASDEVERLEETASYTDRHNGISHVYYQQKAGDTPIFTGVLAVHVDSAGRVQSVLGDAYPGLVAEEAVIGPEQAAKLAARNVGVSYFPERIGEQGRAVVLGRGPLRNDVRVERWVYPLLGTPRPAFRMLLEKNGREWYDILVDAVNGEILHRRNLYQFVGTLTPSSPQEASPAAPRGRVFLEHGLSTVRGTGDLTRKYPYTSDPTGRPRGYANSPLFGADTSAVIAHGGNPANATIAQALLPLPNAASPLRSNALPLSTSPQSPQGWFTVVGGNYSTFGNNVDAKDDQADDDEGTAGARASGGTTGDFSGPAFVYQNHYAQNGPFPSEPPLQPASAQRLAGGAPDLVPATLTVFYLTNWYHDFLYHLGFTEAAGNFQQDNFGKGGQGADSLFADVQDGSGTNNANFGTPPDGQKPRMQMYLFAGPERDGGIDVDLILHEYTHGLSNRLVGGPNNTDCLGTPLVGESGGMGEGWGDWYAAMVTDEPAVAEYAWGDSTNGIRRFPMNAGPNDFTYGFLCTGPVSNPSQTPCEVHDGGEFWSLTLWEMREAMINRVHNGAFPGGPAFPTFTAAGSAAGNIKNAAGRTTNGSGNAANTDHQTIENATFSALFRVTDAMKLAPCNPTIVDMRDAILQADRNLGGEFQDVIWRAFANRGVGELAVSTGGATPAIAESFTVPATVQACEAAGGPRPAPQFTAVSNAANQVTITITPNGAVEYAIDRSLTGAGTAVDPTSFVEIGRTTSAPFTDTGLNGGTTYNYRVRAVTNEDCVSGSVAHAVVPQGGALDCTLDPTFAGLAQVLDAGDCQHLLLDWPEASSNCPGSQQVKYNVYRSPLPFFVLDAGTRIATGVVGQSYLDTPPADDQIFYYVVRAEDSSAGHGGPANGGNEDANTVTRFARVTSGTLVPQGFADDVEQGPDNARSAHFVSSGLAVPQIPERGGWFRDENPAPVDPRSPTHVWHSFDPDNPTFGQSDSLVFELRSDLITITPESILTFFHTFQTETGFDGGVVEFAQVVNESTGALGPFQDLGFLIYEGGYNGVLDATIEGVINNNPLANRAAYTGGLLGPMRRSRAFLGELVPSGQPQARIVLRFLFGNDVGNTQDPSPQGDFLPGWYIDDVTVDASCCPLSPAPAGLAATPGSDTISLSWQAPAGGPIASYEVYREASNEVVPVLFDELLATVPGNQTTYVDSDVSGGILYYYVARAIPASGCPSGNSNVVSASPLAGACLVDPTFAGLESVSAPPGGTCGLLLAWDPAFSNCLGATVRYNVYRSMSASFIPAPTNRLALAVEATSYLDQTDLVHGVTYYYIVRAEDTTDAGGGPAGGNEDDNLVRKSGSPNGPLAPRPSFIDDVEPAAEPGYGTFSTRTAGGWAVTTDPTAHSPTHAWVALDDQPGAPPLTSKDDRLTLPALNLTATSVLRFWHNYDFARFPLASPATRHQSGGVLELSAGSDTWIDLGPYITTGGYTGALDPAAQSPLAGRAGWVGSSDGNNNAGRIDAMQQVVVDVGAAIQTELGASTLPNALVRFRLGGTFQTLLGGIQGSGWGIDDLSVTGLLQPGTCSANSGTVPPTVLVAKVSSTVINLSWEPSCSSGALDYGIYEGTIGSWYDHHIVDCSDNSHNFNENVTTGSGNRYYLVVAHSSADEGSYGRDTAGNERPVGFTTCVAEQVLAPCP